MNRYNHFGVPSVLQLGGILHEPMEELRERHEDQRECHQGVEHRETESVIHMSNNNPFIPKGQGFRSY
jgi:uncharacterized protein with von Willebrand factor type A (vWA) domain